MYQTKHLQAFIDKVHKEAEAAEQSVYDKHTPELIRRIQAQIRDGDTLFIANGTATFGHGMNDNFAKLVSEAGQLYTSASFSVPYKITKTTIEP
jgi:hypothetical protein